MFQVAEMKARTEVLEAELRRKTNIEDRVKAAENNLQSLSTSVESQFSANDRRWAGVVGVFFCVFHPAFILRAF